MVVTKNADGTYTVAPTLLEQRVINRVAWWWDDRSGTRPADDAAVVRALVLRGLLGAANTLRRHDAAKVADAYQAADAATKTNVETTLGITPEA